MTRGRGAPATGVDQCSLVSKVRFAFLDFGPQKGLDKGYDRIFHEPV
jgi:hypothetical protein